MKSRWLVLALVGALFSSVLLGQGPDPETAHRAGAEALRAGNVYDALDLLSIAAAGKPNDPGLQVLLGQANLAAGLWVPARRNFERSLAANPADGLSAFMVGYTLYLSARYTEADTALLRAQELARGNPNPSIYRGLTLLRLGRLEEARAQLRSAGDATRDDPSALRGFAEIALAEGDLVTARDQAMAAAARSPGDVDTRILLAQILIRDRRASEALADLEALALEHPNRSDVLYVHSQALLRSGQREAGRAAVERFRVQKAAEESIRLLEAEVSLHPQDLDRRLDLVGRLLDNDQPGTARLHLAPALRQAPEDPRVRSLIDRVQNP